MVSRLVKKFPVSVGTGIFITVFTIPQNWILLRACWIQATESYLIFVRPPSISFCHQRQRLTSGLLPICSAAKICVHFWFPRVFFFCFASGSSHPWFEHHNNQINSQCLFSLLTCLGLNITVLWKLISSYIRVCRNAVNRKHIRPYFCH
jgi:hypothetical protein